MLQMLVLVLEQELQVLNKFVYEIANLALHKLHYNNTLFCKQNNEVVHFHLYNLHKALKEELQVQVDRSL
jgi:hypothetical protein